jgi:hypothetical protein
MTKIKIFNSITDLKSSTKNEAIHSQSLVETKRQFSVLVQKIHGNETTNNISQTLDIISKK